MTLVSTRAEQINPGDLYIFATGSAATVKNVHRTRTAQIRVTFTDPSVRYGACAPDSLHTIGKS